MNEFGCLLLNRSDYLRMAVTGSHYGYARIEIKEGITVGIFNHSTQAASRHERIASRVRRRDVLPIQFDHSLGLGPGQRSDQARQF